MNVNERESISAARQGPTVINMTSDCSYRLAMLRDSVCHDQQPMEIPASQESKIITCLQHIYFCFTANKSFTRKRRMAAMEKGNTINSVSKIDRASRILFPLSFFVINLFYWWAYVAHDDEEDAWAAMKKNYYL